MSKVTERAIELCEAFCHKSMEETLQEFEVLCYESLCNMVSTMAKCNEASMREDLPELERKARKAEDNEDDEGVKT